MTREYLLYIFEGLTVLLGVILLISGFLFSSKGIVSRKTLIVSFICFVFFMMSIWITAILTKPSIALPALICLSGVTVMVGIFFAIKYLALPSFSSYIDKKKQENDKED